MCEHEEKLAKVLDIAESFGQIDGDHHKLWAFDQIVRIITGDDYFDWVTQYQRGQDGAYTYCWDIGIAP